MDNVCAPLTPICGAIVKSTGKICQCPGDPIRLGRCGRHAPIKPPRKKFEPFVCSICMEECTSIKKQHVTICNHKFHTKCIKKWTIQQGPMGFPPCPNCRTLIWRPSQTPPPTPVPIEVFNVHPHETWNDALNRVARVLLPHKPLGSWTADSKNMHRAMIYDIWETSRFFFHRSSPARFRSSNFV